MSPTMVLADRHVHSQWSWDAAQGDMLATCARAVELGLAALAFTEHADFTLWAALPGPGLPEATRVPVNPGTNGDLDVAGYWQAIDRCRAAYPQLRIESGVELGEPHLFPDEAEAILQHRPLDRILGSLHCLEIDGSLVDASAPGVFGPDHAIERMHRYLDAALALVESDATFSILAHLDYPKRFWCHDQLHFDERDYEEQLRAVLRALARSGRCLEVNSSRGFGPPRGPCPGPTVLRWWHEEGGEAVSFGSDAHSPGQLGLGLREAAEMVMAAGFGPARDRLDLWRRSSR